ncbi:Uncharacterized protein Rs2_40776 [Raphanus sativus]|nr:Uncharacterized protein Rs2_40776 [Raphanus sativus]
MNPDNKSPVSGDHMSKKAASAGPIKPTVESGVSSANSVSVSSVTEKRNGKSVVCSDVPIKGRSGTGVPSAKNAQLVFFRDVKFGPQETQLRFRLIHFWEARNVLTKNLIGLEMLMIDEQLQKALSLSQYRLKRAQTAEVPVSRVIDTTVIPEVTCQTEDDVEKGVVSQGENQTVDNIINKKFVAANPVKDSLHSKRLSVQRKSTRFAVQETQQTETKVCVVVTQAEVPQVHKGPTTRSGSAGLRNEFTKAVQELIDQGLKQLLIQEMSGLKIEDPTGSIEVQDQPGPIQFSSIVHNRTGLILSTFNLGSE